MKSVKQTKYTSSNEVKWDEPSFDQVNWLNVEALDYKLLKNKPN